MIPKQLPFPAPVFRDRLERNGWREYPADIRVRVRRYFRAQDDDIIMVEYNGDIVHLYRPVTTHKEAAKLCAKLPPPKKRRKR